MESDKDINDLTNEGNLQQENDICIPKKEKKGSSAFEGMHMDVLMQVIKKMTAKDFVRMYRTCKAVKKSIDNNPKLCYQLENKNLMLFSGNSEDPSLYAAVLQVGSKFHHVCMSTIRFFKFPAIFVSIVLRGNEEEAVSLLQKMNTGSSMVFLCVKQPWKFFDVINLNKVVFFGMTQTTADALKDKNVQQVIVYLSRFHEFERDAFRSLGEKVKIAESPRSFWRSDLNTDPTYICKEDDLFEFLLDMDDVEMLTLSTLILELEMIIQMCMNYQTYPITEMTIPKRIFDAFECHRYVPTLFIPLLRNGVCTIPKPGNGLFMFALIVEEDKELCQKSVILRFGAKSMEDVQHLIPEKDREEISKNVTLFVPHSA